MTNEERERKFDELGHAICKAQHDYDDFLAEQVWECQQKTPGGFLPLIGEDDCVPSVEIEGKRIYFDAVKYAPVMTEFVDAEDDEQFEYDSQLHFRVENGDGYTKGYWMKKDDFWDEEYEWLVQYIQWPD